MTSDECGSTIQLDGGYDSFAIHAGYWGIFRIHPLIDPSDNAVINEEGTRARIDHWVNWKSSAHRVLLKAQGIVYLICRFMAQGIVYLKCSFMAQGIVYLNE